MIQTKPGNSVKYGAGKDSNIKRKRMDRKLVGTNRSEIFKWRARGPVPCPEKSISQLNKLLHFILNPYEIHAGRKGRDIDSIFIIRIYDQNTFNGKYFNYFFQVFFW